MKASIPVCLLMLMVSFNDGFFFKKLKRAAGSAWECHPGCKRFCLSSCKRSCCAPGAPNYSPDMFPQLVSYQRSLPPPPPPPPSCPTGCPTTCYPICDAGCCSPVSEPAAYPQYPAGPYGPGYVGYDTGAPCAAQGCSTSCAPLCKPDCCRSQALNLSIRPAYLPGSSSPVRPPKRAIKPAKAYPKKKKQKKVNKASKKVGVLCIPKCQELCKPVCRFDCCLPTHKFPKKHAAHRPRPFKSNKPAPQPASKAATAVSHIRPVASPQPVPDIKVVVPPSDMNSLAQLQATRYAGDYNADPPAQAMGPAMPGVANCPGDCPMECSPSCDWSCCSPYIKSTLTQSIPGPQQLGLPAVQQASLYAAVPANPMSQAIYPTPRAPVSPGLVPTQPMSCPSPTCPDACAPQCSRNCCDGRNLLPQQWDKRSSKPDWK